MTALLEYASPLNPQATVFVVDDDPSTRKSLETLIRKAGWRPKLFASAQAFLDDPLVYGPGCVVLEATLPDRNGLDVQRITAANRPHVPIIFVTARGDVAMTVQAMKAGAFDFLTKPIGPEALMSSIRCAIDRSAATIGRAAETRALRERYSSLTQRECQVFSLVVTGLLNKQVAENLCLSVTTVKAYRGSVMRKLQAESLAELVRMDAILSRAWRPGADLRYNGRRELRNLR